MIVGSLNAASCHVCYMGKRQLSLPSWINILLISNHSPLHLLLKPFGVTRPLYQFIVETAFCDDVPSSVLVACFVSPLKGFASIIVGIVTSSNFIL